MVSLNLALELRRLALAPGANQGVFLYLRYGVPYRLLLASTFRLRAFTLDSFGVTAEGR